MVSLYENGKIRQGIVREYELTESALDRWITQFRQSDFFKEKDNRPQEEQELIVLRKRNKQLEMEVAAKKAQQKLEKECLLKEVIIEVFNNNRQVYRTWKLKVELDKENKNFIIS